MIIAPPRLAESLLEALGAGPRFSESLLGDLAEEFARRRERDGAAAARRWYSREAFRAAPHLFGDWARRLGAAGVCRLAGIVVLTYTILFMIGFFVGHTVMSVMEWRGIALDHLRANSPLMLALGMTVGTIGTTLGGYIAGWLNRDAPLATAIAVGGVWAIVNIVSGMVAIIVVGPASAPLWMRVLGPALLLTSSAVGGVLRVRERRVVIF